MTVKVFNTLIAFSLRLYSVFEEEDPGMNVSASYTWTSL